MERYDFAAYFHSDDHLTVENVLSDLEKFKPFSWQYLKGIFAIEEFVKSNDETIALLKEKELYSFVLSDEDDLGADCRTVLFNRQKKISKLSFRLFYNDIFPLELITVLLKKHKLFYAQFSNNEDEYDQSVQHLDYYIRKGYDPNKLKLSKDMFGKTVVDISNNFGRRENFLNISFSVSPLMWFGKEFIRLIGRDKFTEIQKEFNFKEWENGILELKLYDGYYKSNDEVFRKIQEKIWHCLDINRFLGSSSNGVVFIEEVNI